MLLNITSYYSEHTPKCTVNKCYTIIVLQLRVHTHQNMHYILHFTECIAQYQTALHYMAL